VLEFTEYLPDSMHAKARGKFPNSPRISNHLWHAGVVVNRADQEKWMAFLQGKLGFTEFWRGGPESAPLAWINMRTPGTRGDYLELMLSDPNPTRERLGSMQHICLQVPDIQAAYRTVQSRDTEHTQKQTPKIGRNRKWQLNLFDPDGSRVELMEPNAVAESRTDQ
jgi:lactoylglutathione lyase